MWTQWFLLLRNKRSINLTITRQLLRKITRFPGSLTIALRVSQKGCNNTKPELRLWKFIDRPWWWRRAREEEAKLHEWDVTRGHAVCSGGQGDIYSQSIKQIMVPVQTSLFVGWLADWLSLWFVGWLVVEWFVDLLTDMLPVRLVVRLGSCLNPKVLYTRIDMITIDPSVANLTQDRVVVVVVGLVGCCCCRRRRACGKFSDQRIRPKWLSETCTLGWGRGKCWVCSAPTAPARQPRWGWWQQTFPRHEARWGCNQLYRGAMLVSIEDWRSCEL